MQLIPITVMLNLERFLFQSIPGQMDCLSPVMFVMALRRFSHFIQKWRRLGCRRQKKYTDTSSLQSAVCARISTDPERVRGYTGVS